MRTAVQSPACTVPNWGPTAKPTALSDSGSEVDEARDTAHLTDNILQSYLDVATGE